MLRRAGLLAVLIAAIACVHWRFQAGVAGQQPESWPDSAVFLEIAAQPAAVAQVFSAKPLVTPMLYRWLGRDVQRIVAAQTEVSFFCWCLFALALLANLRLRRARALAVLVAAGLLFAPYRRGWTTAVLSESFNDSLLALVLAGLLAERALAQGRPVRFGRTLRFVTQGALFVAVTAWALIRDTNAIVVAVGGVLALAVWRHRSPAERLSIAIPALLAALGVMGFWSAHVAPADGARVSLNATWRPELAARTGLPLLNNVFARVLADTRAATFFADAGMPMSPRLQDFVAQYAFFDRYRFLREPAYRREQDWVIAHGESTYLKWIVAHPFKHAGELASEGWQMIRHPTLESYMPPGWVDRRNVIDGLLSAGLAAVGIFALWRGCPGFLNGLARFTVGTGLFGFACAFFGDAFEIERHCYGPIQQVFVGLLLAVIGMADARRSPV